MPSLNPGFNHDIFISYRHNDNRSGWVTEFVRDLEEELAATIKEPVSVYFDINPHDGLLESHSVDKTLEEKLKCLIFIPVLSQTYCDPKSFAWQNEFIRFHKLAREDEFGVDVRLRNGNIASRILPVKIHELDSRDKSLVEHELGGALRAIDFTFRAAGVNRPLKPHEDHPNENLSKTDYRDQVNKLANAIKELLHGIQAGENRVSESGGLRKQPVIVSTKKTVERRRLTLISAAALSIVVLVLIGWYFAFSGSGSGEGKSIAVLPFKNLSKDADQEYFTQGITEDILNHLSKIADLKVKASYASFSFDESTKSITEIGRDLDVGSILTGSIQREGKNVRVIATLIDVESNEQIWSEKYDRELDEVLRLQSDIAAEIARYLKAKLSTEEVTSIQRPVAQSIDAYEYYLKAKKIVLKGGELPRGEFNMALSLLNSSIALDPTFSDAYALKGWTWRSASRFGYPSSIWLDSCLYFANKAIDSDPGNPSGYLLRSQLNQYNPNPLAYGDPSDLEKAYSLAPNNTDILIGLGQSYLRNKNAEGADLLVKFARLRFTESDADYHYFWSGLYAAVYDYDKAEAFLTRARELDRSSTLPTLQLAYLKVRSGNYRQAVDLAGRVGRELVAKGADPVELLRPYDIIAESYGHLGNIDSSLYFFSKFHAIEMTFQDSTQFVPYRHRAAHMFWLKGDKKRAMTLFRAQQHFDSSRITGTAIGGWGDITGNYYDLAISHAFLGEEEAAFKCFEQLRLRGIEGWMFWYLKTDLLLEDFRRKPRFVEFFELMKEEEEFKVNALRRAINLHEASKELKDQTK